MLALYLQIRDASRIITGLLGDAERQLLALLQVHIAAAHHRVIAHFKERDG
jgi:hypothetical protein